VISFSCLVSDKGPITYLLMQTISCLQGFASGFKGELKGVNVLFMQSDGGLTPAERFGGVHAIVSGPAGA